MTPLLRRLLRFSRLLNLDRVTILGGVTLIVCLLPNTGDAETAMAVSEQQAFFERKIRPVLVEHCFECHAGEADLIQGGLRLDDPAAMRRGGDTGAAVVPGKPDESLLLAALRYDELEMPPEGKLDERVIRDFATWIKMGAVDPRRSTEPSPVTDSDEPLDLESARQFWAFQPPQSQPAPATVHDNWVTNRIDSFVAAKREASGLAPNPPADKRRFIRRVTFDLTGLPPTLPQIEQYVNDDSPDAKEKLVQRLLASPAHAERWARMWLDVSRYAEDQAHIVGNNDSLTYPNAYLYRDWVIEAFLQDMPYDDFVRMQLAADAMVPSETDQHLALGFLGLGPKYYRRRDPAVMADEWEDRVDTVTRGLLGLTVACARCHDHKFDPIPTADYYSLAGVFASTAMYNRPLSDNQEIETTEDGQAKKPADAVHIVRDGQPRDLHVMIRGDVNKQGDLAERGFLTVLSERPIRFEEQSGRRELAEAIVDPSNPLTARVIVNRVWHELFGRGLVDTPSNFGQLGSRPTHPKLLDDLSVRFMQNGWSLKWLQREIVLSATYGQSSQIDSHHASIDPDNRLLWRMPRRRLSVEGYRDALLAVSNRLDRTIGGPSLQPDDPDSTRRTLYSKISRLDLNPMLARFDFPDPNAHSAARYETTTPLQKLFLLNSPFMVRQSDALASDLQSQSGSVESRIRIAYQRLYARPPSAQELQLGLAFLKSDSQDVWTQYAQTLLISNEMFMVD